MSSVIQNLEQYLKKFAPASMLAKGRALVREVKLVRIDNEKGAAYFEVKSQSYSNQKYRIDVERLLRGDIVSACTCPYDYGNICKHEVASVLYLINYLKDHPISGEVKKYKMLDTSMRMLALNDSFLKQHSTEETWKKRNTITLVEIISALNGVAETKVTFKKDDFQIKFNYNLPASELHSSCSCNQEILAPLCEHKLASLMLIREKFGQNGFEMMKDWTDDKNKQLAEYGFSLNDKIDDKFDFQISGGKMLLLKKDPSIQKLSDYQNWRKIGKGIFTSNQIISIKKNADEENETDVLYVLKPQSSEFNFADFDFNIYTHKYSPKTGKITYLKQFNGLYGEELPEIDDQTRQIFKYIKRFNQTDFQKYLKKKHDIEYYYFHSMPDETKQEVQIIIGTQLTALLQLLEEKKVFIQPENSYYGVSTVADLTQISINSQPKKPIFYLKEDENFVVLEAFVEINNKLISLSNIPKTKYFWLFFYGNILFKWSQYRDASIAGLMFSSGGKLKVRKSNFEGFFSDFVLPLTDNFEVEFQIEKPMETQNLTWNEGRIYLKEDEENLIIVPAYSYKNGEEELEFEQDGRTSKVDFEDGKIMILDRDGFAEQQIYESILALHPNFQHQTGQHYFHVPYADVMKDQWFFKFFDALKEKELKIFGLKDLKMKYNPHRPNIQMRTSSGIDWFDMTVEIQFGEQFASLKDIRKAVMKKQNFVELKDGSLGMLPEDWLQKYANLFRFANIKDDSLRISKLHFTLIEELASTIDNEEILEELRQKRHKLLNFKEIQNVELPKNIKADLRQYQQEGYKWLHFLDEFGWGGCLADDMGLGKTLQMLTFLQEQKNRHKKVTNLVVMPTTLIFNWQAEIEKFCPKMTYFVFHGAARTKDSSTFKNYDVILTTYGTLRSDIELFMNFQFHYIILDESQAIKNPTSQIAKAVKLLKAKNRLVMTGTPIENNTFDLYSQFEFINPGFLGTEEFFKSEFATPIDKYQDKEITEQLRKMVYPFMLKRTKDEVAKDLPDKTETILFCEMGKKQRKVYDTFREKYRNQLLNKFETDGKEKSSMLVLEALLKLRQICDSPVLLSDDGEFTDESIKLDEIVREIEENASNHKILIFSQFLKMLELVRNHLDKNNIVYEYLDGSTSDRAAKVKRFQSDKNCRVFLISLKAGGVGLNLTEADYVYLIDPWWNPAVETQAIDRTHRIGQTKKVFAYKMICKDSVEEKILTLQARKKDLASDLVGAEAGFIKKLSQADIIDLFS